MEFATCYGDRLSVEIQGQGVAVYRLENLRRNKQASGRFQDLADLENLQ